MLRTDPIFEGSTLRVLFSVVILCSILAIGFGSVTTVTAATGQTSTPYNVPQELTDISAQNNTTLNATRTADGLKFSSPAFVDGRQYTISITVSTTDGQTVRYVKSVTASGNSTTIQQAALSVEDQIIVTVLHNENRLFDERTITVQDVDRSSNAKADFGNEQNVIVIKNLSIEAPAEIQSIWLKAEGMIKELEPKNITVNETTNLTLVSPLKGSNGTLLLKLAESPGTIKVPLNESSGDASQQNLTASTVGGARNNTTNKSVGIFNLLGGEFGKNIGYGLIGLLVGILIFGLLDGWLPFYDGLNFLRPNRKSTEQSKTSYQRNGSSSVSSGGSPPPQQSRNQYPFSLTLIDGLTGERYPGSPRVSLEKLSTESNQFRPRGSIGRGPGHRNRGNEPKPHEPARESDNSRIQKTVSDGHVQFELEEGTWRIKITENSQTLTEGKFDLTGEKTKDLEIPPTEIGVKVLDGMAEDQPLSDAEITVKPDVGGVVRKTTDTKGWARIRVSRATTTGEVTVESEGYEPESAQIDLRDDRVGWQPTLQPSTGTLQVEVKLAGVGLGGVPVEIAPADDRIRDLVEEKRDRTNDQGRVIVENLLVGSYRVDAEPRLQQVDAEVEGTTITLSGGTTTVELTVNVPYSLPSDYRESLSSLHDRIDTLASATNRDVAVPRYFGSVIADTLGMVDTVEQNPEVCVAGGHSPDDVVEALLAAADTGLSAVEGAMNVTRNVKLFRACNSMEPAEVTWHGDIGVVEYLKRVDNGATKERRKLRDRLSEVDDFLDTKWNEVGELGPAREMYDRVSELTKSGDIDDELGTVAQVYVAFALLEAIEGLFEHEALRDRLDKTVF